MSQAPCLRENLTSDSFQTDSKGRNMEFMMEHWLSLSAGIFLLAMVLYGHYRGFLRAAVSMLALILSVLLVRVATPYITTFIKENTKLQERIEHTLADAVGLSEEELNIRLPAQQRMVIEQLDLPSQMKEVLLENNNSEIYHLLGVDTFLEYIGSYVASMILNLIGSVVLFLLIHVAIRMTIRWLNLLARLPILSGLNQIAGALLGGLEGLLCLWGGCVAADLFSHTAWASAILEQIHASMWLTFLYQNNLINQIFISILRSLV